MAVRCLLEKVCAYVNRKQEKKNDYICLCHRCLRIVIDIS
uniref:Uncharacterized protein n=1 Tax=Anguilla anguilla TaxID=7936 RepID=A0A0E9U3N6_ANGAN